MAPKKAAKAAGDGPDPFSEFFEPEHKRLMNLYKDVPKLEEGEAYKELLKVEGTENPGSGATEWNFTKEFDPMAFRLIFHALRNKIGENKTYCELKAVRVWNCNGGDESVRSVCHYLNVEAHENMTGVKDLQFVDNGVTALGCEFLGETLGPKGKNQVELLRLDYNQFGTVGVEKLSMGLSQNATLRHLSLQYCAIGEDGGQYIAHILMYFRCALERLDLRGNYLMEKGVVDVFNGARRTKQLQSVDVYDNKFADTPEVIEAIQDIFTTNTKITQYNLGGNQITDEGASKLVQAMIPLSHLQQVMVSERCKATTFEALEQTLGGAKGKKGKKGKKK